MENKSKYLERIRKATLAGVMGVTAIGMMAACSDSSTSSSNSSSSNLDDDCDEYVTNSNGDEVCHDHHSYWYGHTYIGNGYYNEHGRKVYKSDAKSYFSKSGSSKGSVVSGSSSRSSKSSVSSKSSSTSTSSKSSISTGKSGGFSSGARGGFGG